MHAKKWFGQRHFIWDSVESLILVAKLSKVLVHILFGINQRKGTGKKLNSVKLIKMSCYCLLSQDHVLRERK
jgi:hypothetical protein